MRDQLLARLETLRNEFANGVRAKAELEAQRDSIYERIDTLEKTMLRISGAIQVLEEVIDLVEEPSPLVPLPQGEGNESENSGRDVEREHSKE